MLFHVLLKQFKVQFLVMETLNILKQVRHKVLYVQDGHDLALKGNYVPRPRKPYNI